MIQRYEIYRPYHFCYPKCDPINADDSGEFVLYTDHLAAIAEKDKEIERLKSIISNYKTLLQHKDIEIEDLMKRMDTIVGWWLRKEKKEDSDATSSHSSAPK